MANIIKKLIPKIKYKRDCECKNALEHAVITSPEHVIKNVNPRVNKVLLEKYIK